MRATNSITSKQNLRGLKSNSLHIYIVKIFKIFAIMGRTRYVVRPNSAYIVRITGIVARYGANEIRRSPQLCTYRPHYWDCCALWGERDMSFAPTLHITPALLGLLRVMGRTRYVVRPNSAYIVRISGIVERYIYSPSTLGTCDSLFSCHYPLCFLLLVFRYSIACLNMVK